MSYLEWLPSELLNFTISYLNANDLNVINYGIHIEWLQLITFRFPQIYRPLILEYNLEQIYRGMLYYETRGTLKGFEDSSLYLNLVKYLFTTDQDEPNSYQIAALDDVDLYLKYYALDHHYHRHRPEWSTYLESPNIMKYLIDKEMMDSGVFAYSMEFLFVSKEVACLFLNKFEATLDPISIIRTLFKYDFSNEEENKLISWLPSYYFDSRLTFVFNPYRDSKFQTKYQKVYDKYKHLFDQESMFHECFKSFKNNPNQTTTI